MLEYSLQTRTGSEFWIATDGLNQKRRAPSSLPSSGPLKLATSYSPTESPCGTIGASAAGSSAAGNDLSGFAAARRARVRSALGHRAYRARRPGRSGARWPRGRASGASGATAGAHHHQHEETPSHRAPDTTSVEMVKRVLDTIPRPFYHPRTGEIRGPSRLAAVEEALRAYSEKTD